VSISPRSYDDFTMCSLVLGSDLENLHRGEECRERAKTRNRVFLNSMRGLRWTGRSTDMHKDMFHEEEEPNWVGRPPGGRHFQ